MTSPVDHATGPARAARLGSVLGWLCVGTSLVVVGCVVAGYRPLVGADLARGVVAGVAFGGLGGTVARRRPELSLGWLMLLVGLSNALSVAGDTWAKLALVDGVDSLPGGSTAYWISSWSWAPGYLVPVTLLLLLFPTGAPPSPRWRPVVWGAALTIAVATVGWALTPYDAQDIAPDPVFGPVRSPWHVPGAEVLLQVALPAFLLTVLLCLSSLALRWRAARGTERAQLVWVLLAGSGVVVLFALGFALPALAPVLVATAMVPLPAALTLAILRRGLWQLDHLLSRTLVYGGLTLTILSGYAALVSTAGLALGDLGDGERLVALVVVAVAAQPLHGWLTRGVNRLLFADRDEPWAAVDRLAAELALLGHDPLDAVVDTVVRALRLPWALVEAPGHPPVERGAPGPTRVEVPLVHQGRRVGLLTVSPPRGSEALGPREQQLLDRLARQAALATHAAALQQDLQRSREQLVLSREEERRRLRRDLHDGLGPLLSAAAMKLEAAGDLVTSDPERARAMLVRAQDVLRSSVSDVRRIVDDLRPPSLDGLGLVGAVSEVLDQFEGGPVAMRLSVEAPHVELDRLPAAVEVAAYRIVSEAITNAVRHADPRSVLVGVSLEGGDLVVSVEDDGRGIATDIDLGVGLGSMHERAAELGGTCALDSSALGTRVVARLPRGGGGS